MLNVVGGTYGEVCKEPEWNQLFGSGLRAAASLAVDGGRPRLTTYVGPKEVALLEQYAESFGIELEAKEAQQTLRFTYGHALARPWIDPPLHLVQREAPLQVQGEAVLRFGMLEGEAEVHGSRVVYDPQSAYQPSPFGRNGSTAESLAILANLREASDLTGRQSLDEVGMALLEEGAAVVVVKCGPIGARLFSSEGAHDIPAFRTERVFPIGSGDVFAAVFAHHWAESGESPVDAAMAASRATAYYCATRVLPVPSDPEGLNGVGSALTPTREPEARRVYLAGPFFTAAQRWLIEQARAGLKAQGLNVFSPFHDIGLGPAQEVAQEDLAALSDSDVVLAIVDGLDAGTLFEIGYARALGLPVVAFVENEPEEPLKMVVGGGCKVADDFVSAIYQAVWAAVCG